MAVQKKEAAGDQSQSKFQPKSQHQPKNSYCLAKCVLKGSVVLQAVYGHIRSPTTLDVVFGKETALELVVVSENGMVQSVCEQTVFGTIKDLAVLPWNDQCRAAQPQTYGKDLLVVLSDSGKLSFLTFSVEMHRFLAVAHIHLSQSRNLRRELGRLLAVESKGRAIAVAAFEDSMAVFPVTIAAGNNIVEEKIVYPMESIMQVAETETGRGWGTIWSMSFVSCKGGSILVLAVLLHRREAALNELQVLVCDTKERTIHLRSQFSSPGPLALNVAGIPAIPGFALLFRNGDFILLDLMDPSNPCPVSCVRLSRLTVDEEMNVSEEYGGQEGDEEGSFNVAASALLELSDSRTSSAGRGDIMCIDSEQSKVSSSSTAISSWSWEPDYFGNPRLVLCLDVGEVFIAEFLLGGQDGIKITVSNCLYKCSPCKALLWTKGGFIAALVEMGDGQVLKIEEGTLVCRSLIQNIAPILDISLVDYHNEKQDQMFACCGMGREGSLRIIRNGISVEKLHSTPPIYQGVTGTWTMRMKHHDSYHSFLVISFVEETRVLSVGLNFVDITDAVGFDPNASTLACGLMEEGRVVQVCRNEVRLCAPTAAAHPAGLALSVPFCTSWRPKNLSISLGAIAWRTIILAMSSPGILLMLGIRTLPSGGHELFEVQKVKLQAEVSCIAIPQEELGPSSLPASIVGLIEDSSYGTFPNGVEIGKVCVVGTHKPSVELLSMVPGENFTALAVGSISLTNTMGTAVSGCVPQDVRLALFDRLYILSGLRNGMLLRYEWPISSIFSSELPSPNSALNTLRDANGSFTVSYESCHSQDKINFNKMDTAEGSFPVQLQLIAVRRVGITPVFLVPLCESLHSDIIALSDRPWLIQIARDSQRIAYTSISFRPATHATPVSSIDCPKGILFVADCSLHLVEMVHTKRLNVQKLLLGRTPRRVLYHSESKTLLVMQSECYDDDSSPVSDICCVDPVSGSLLSTFRLDPGETAKCMRLWKVGSEQVLVVGTGLSVGRAIMPSGEAEGSKGRLLILQIEPIHSSRSGMVRSSSVSSSVAAPGSPFHDEMAYNPENATNSNAGGSPDEPSCEGVRFEEGGGWQLTLKWHVSVPGIVLAVCPYLEQYILASAGNSLFCLGFPTDAPQRLKRFSSVKTRFTITCITVHLTRIAVGDCRDGILFYSYQEDTRKLEQLYCDPVQRLVADCVLMDLDTAFVSDRRGNFCALSCPNLLEENASPERNLTLSCWYHLGEAIMRIQKGSFSYKLPMDDGMKACSRNEILLDGADNAVVASTLLGSVVIFIQLNREEYDLLDAVQVRLASYPLTAPVLGNIHSQFRGRGSPVGVCKVLDGDMLAQFLELTSMQQQAVLAGQPGPTSDAANSAALQRSIPVDQVLRLLERVHNALN
jgi:splicing factor 3B subunit 3